MILDAFIVLYKVVDGGYQAVAIFSPFNANDNTVERSTINLVHFGEHWDQLEPLMPVSIEVEESFRKRMLEIRNSFYELDKKGPIDHTPAEIEAIKQANAEENKKVDDLRINHEKGYDDDFVESGDDSDDEEDLMNPPHPGELTEKQAPLVRPIPAPLFDSTVRAATTVQHAENARVLGNFIVY